MTFQEACQRAKIRSQRDGGSRVWIHATIISSDEPDAEPYIDPTGWCVDDWCIEGNSPACFTNGMPGQ